MKKFFTLLAAILFMGCICSISYADEFRVGDTVVLKRPAESLPHYAACSSRKVARKAVVYYQRAKYPKYGRFMTKGLCVQAKAGTKFQIASLDDDFAEVKWNNPAVSTTLWVPRIWIKNSR